MLRRIKTLLGLSSDTSSIATTCPNCDHFRSGHIDRQANYVRCSKGHRLIDDEAMTIEHQPFGDPEEAIIRVDRVGWHDQTGGEGPAMFDREDCSDWKPRRFRLDLGNPEYD